MRKRLRHKPSWSSRTAAPSTSNLAFEFLDSRRQGHSLLHLFGEGGGAGGGGGGGAGLPLIIYEYQSDKKSPARWTKAGEVRPRSRRFFVF